MYRLLTSLVLLCALGHAVAAPTNEEIIIRADSATLNQTQGFAIYQGKAELHQGVRSLSADWLKIELRNGQPLRIEARGAPVQLTDGDTLEARGNRLVYEVAERRIRIYEQAYVNHQGRIFEGAELEYQLDSKQVDARGGDDGRVKLVIPAEELE